jgi:hypothetical protein
MKSESIPIRSSGERQTALPDDRAVDGETAVETFMYEVSAGKKSAQSPTSDPPRTQPVRVELPPLADKTLRPEQVVLATDGKRRVDVAMVRPRPSKGAKKQWRMPPWMASVLIHVVGIIPLGFITIASLDQTFDFSLTMSAEPAVADEVTIDEIAIEPPAEFENLENHLVSEITQATAVTGDLNAEVALADLSSVSLADGALSDAEALFGTQGGGLSEIAPSGEKLTASFFGTKVDGLRILYVLDNSGGMRDGGFEALVDELLRSVESLSAEQEFYVIFYSDMVYPLFHPRPVERFVPASDRFKQRLKVWLDSVEFCVGNSVDEAIATAAIIRPDALYLLTDGDVNTTLDGRKMAALVDTRGRDFPIHTFGIGMREASKAADNLRQVAEANEGTFRIVEVSSEAKERAKQKNRPYHNKNPGEVWGLNVGSSWGK